MTKTIAFNDRSLQCYVNTCVLCEISKNKLLSNSIYSIINASKYPFHSVFTIH